MKFIIRFKTNAEFVEEYGVDWQRRDSLGINCFSFEMYRFFGETIDPNNSFLYDGNGNSSTYDVNKLYTTLNDIRFDGQEVLRYRKYYITTRMLKIVQITPTYEKKKLLL